MATVGLVMAIFGTGCSSSSIGSAAAPTTTTALTYSEPGAEATAAKPVTFQYQTMMNQDAFETAQANRTRRCPQPSFGPSSSDDASNQQACGSDGVGGTGNADTMGLDTGADQVAPDQAFPSQAKAKPKPKTKPKAKAKPPVQLAAASFAPGSLPMMSMDDFETYQANRRRACRPVYQDYWTVAPAQTPAGCQQLPQKEGGDHW